ncbi:MAG: class I SAM-dependent methyltransferase [Oscillospiraceae bacterium]|nr:class I SAM-dependent methyltransferase [Oscillospiraceae bacterium]
MTDHEQKWDARLHIQTIGRDSSNADEYRFPYEPTPYCVLERLADSGILREDDVILDYGCGKGRVGFFLSDQIGAKTIGIEYDEQICRGAMENKKASESRSELVLARAEAYEVPADVTCCYFFNPFSVEILRKVMARIVASYYETPREMLLFFYYPSDEYISYLMTVDELEFYDEISCEDLFEGKDPRERIMAFVLPDYTI